MAVAVLLVLALTASLVATPTASAAEPDPEPEPNRLVFTTQPAGGQGGTAFATQPVVTVQDGEGATVATEVEVSLTLAGGTAGAILTCASTTTSAGVATFTNCSIDKAGSGYTLHATATAVDPADSAAFDVVTGPPTELVFVTQPSPIAAGVAFDPAPAIELRDAGNNPVAPTGYTLGLIAANAGGGPVALSNCAGGDSITDQGATFHSRSPDEGQTAATFPGCTVGIAGTDYTLLAVAVPADAEQQVMITYSSAFDVGSGAPTRLAFVTQPGGWNPGSDLFVPPLERQPVVAVQDALGNVVDSYGNIALRISGDDVELDCDTTTGWPPQANSMEATAGVAAFEDCAIRAVRTTFQDTGMRTGSYTITATSGSLEVQSAPFGMAVGGAGSAVADEVRFATQPGSGTGGLPLSTQPIVEIVDAGGAAVPGAIELALAGDPQDATLRCSSPLAPAPFGSAALYGCAVDRAGTYQFEATDLESGLTATSDPFDVVPGAPVSATFSAAPTQTLAGAPFAATVELLDAGGNVVTSSGDDVRLSLAAGPNSRSATLDCDDGPVEQTVDGEAPFDACTIDRLGAYRLIATTPVGVALSDEFTVLLGPPASVTWLSAPAAAIDGGLLATSKVLVEDAGGNPVDASVSLAATGGTLTDCQTTETADHGIAVFPACTLGAAGDSLTLEAMAGDVIAAVDVPVSHDEPVGAAGVAIPVPQTFGGSAYATNPTSVTNHVNSATGALVLESEDLRVAGIGIPFVLTRTYNSADTTGGVFGRGWSSLLDAGVVVGSNGTATVRSEDGQQVTFTAGKCKGKRKGVCKWIAPPGADVDLACVNTACTVERRDGVTLVSEHGRVHRLHDRHGNGLAVSRDAGGMPTSVSLTTSGAPLVVDIETVDGRVTQVTTPTRTVSYEYANGLLTGYTDPSGNVSAHRYEAGRLVERTLGQERLQASYGADGRVDSAAASGSQRRHADTYTRTVDPATGVETSARHSATTIRGVESTATHYGHHLGNVPVGEQWPDGATVAYTFDDHGRLTAFQDPQGRVMHLAYSGAGDLLSQTAADGGTVSFTYDGERRVVTTTDQLGNTTEYAHANNNLRWVTPPDPADPANDPGPRGEVGTKFDYDAFGQIIRVETPRSIRTISRDEFGNETGHQTFDRSDAELSASLNGMGPLVAFDESGNIVSSVDPRGHLSDGTVDPVFETRFEYDANGRLLSTIAPNGDVSATTYTPAGQTASTTLPGAGTTTYAWDEPTRTRTATGARPGTWVFDAAGNLLSKTSSSGARTAWTYDATGLTVTETDSTNVTTSQYHDATGNIVRVDDAAGRVELEYAFDRLVTTRSDGLVETTTHDLAGNVTGTTDVDGRTISYTYNNHGDLSSVTNAAGTTSYDYDADDVIEAVTDGNGHTTTFANDAAGRRVQKALGPNVWTYGYDDSDNLVTSTDPDGRVTTWTVDALDRQVGIVHAQPGQPTIEIAQAFDARGRRVGMTDPTGVHTFAYDDSGHLTSAATPSGTFSYDYSTPGHRTDTYPDGTAVTYRYDDSGRVMSVSAPGVEAAYTRDSIGAITGIATGNGLFETFGYDAEGRLVSQQLRCATDEVMTTRYGYDEDFSPLGSERVIGDQVTTAGYGYDATRQLAAQEHDVTGELTLPGTACVDPATAPDLDPPAPGDPGAPALPDHVNDPLPTDGLTGLVPATANPITYDAVGNRRSADGVTYAYGTADQLLSGSDGRSATYDGAGNLTSSTVDGETTTFGYDAAGRLTSVASPDGRLITYTLDGDGTRVGKAIDGVHATTYLWDRSSDVALLVLELDSSGDFRRYVYGVGPVAMQTDDATYYFHSDRRASITALTDGHGAIVEAYTYDAFGNSTVVSSSEALHNPLRFGGQFLDEDTGLYHLRAREYDPAIGRFTQPDPVVRLVGDPVVSPYIYADNQPTILGDVTGELPLPIEHVGYSNERSDEAFYIRTGLATGRFVGTKVMPKVLKWHGVHAALRQSSTGVSTLRNAAKFTKYAGNALAVAGVGLSAYLVYEECTNGSTAQCVGASIGLAFNVGCLAVSGGVATVACVVVGAGLQFVATNYGPDIAEFSVTRAKAYEDSQLSVSGVVGIALVAAVTAVCAFVVTIGTVGVATAMCAVGGLLLGSYVWQIGGAIDRAVVAGFNDLADAVSSGFNDAMDLLGNAGLEMSRFGSMLVEMFQQDALAVLAQFEALGASIEDTANAMVGLFTPFVGDLITFMGDAGYEVEQIVSAVDAAFGDAAEWTDQAFVDAMSAAGFALDETIGALHDVVGLTAAGFTQVGKGLNIAAAEIAAGLDSAYAVTAAGFAELADQVDLGTAAIAAGLATAYEATAAATAAILDDLGHAPELIGAALDDAYSAAAGWTEQALADALFEAGFAANEIARGLSGAYDAAAAEVAQMLLTLQFGVSEVTMALRDAYGAAAAEVAAILVDLGVAVQLIADALGAAYGLVSSALGDVLRDAGAALEDLGDLFEDLGNDIGEALDPGNWW